MTDVIVGTTPSYGWDSNQSRFFTVWNQHKSLSLTTQLHTTPLIETSLVSKLIVHPKCISLTKGHDKLDFHDIHDYIN